MGMFDTIHCTYDLGPGFYMKDLQTKDLSCSMTEYWLCPNGNLYEINYSGTSDFVERMPGDDCYSESAPWANFVSVPNGNRGTIQITNYTGYCEVYPAVWTAHYAAYPRKILHFVDGKLNGTL